MCLSVFSGVIVTEILSESRVIPNLVQVMFGVGCPDEVHVKVSGFPLSTNVSHDVLLFIVGGANIYIKEKHCYLKGCIRKRLS